MLSAKEARRITDEAYPKKIEEQRNEVKDHILKAAREGNGSCNYYGFICNEVCEELTNSGYEVMFNLNLNGKVAYSIKW